MLSYGIFVQKSLHSIEKKTKRYTLSPSHPRAGAGARPGRNLYLAKKLVVLQSPTIIVQSINHPQTNGRLERLFGEYKKHRSAFSSFDEFITWHDNRPHGSLHFHVLETPEMAFRRKMPLEAYFAIG